MRGAIIVALCVGLSFNVRPAWSGEVRQAQTVGGAPVKVIEDWPSGKGPFPAVVFANGGTGDMFNPVPTGLATALTARGIAVVRFDWRYRTANPEANPEKARQSEKLDDEAADLEAAISLARGDPRIRQSAIVLMGKSLGSVVASRVFSEDHALKGLILLTPLCGPNVKPEYPKWMSAPYPTLPKETRPLAMIAGDADPLCSTNSLYKLATSLPGPVRVAVVDGDHGFSDSKSAARSIKYIDLAVRNAVAAAAAYLDLP